MRNRESSFRTRSGPYDTRMYRYDSGQWRATDTNHLHLCNAMTGVLLCRCVCCAWCGVCGAWWVGEWVPSAPSMVWLSSSFHTGTRVPVNMGNNMHGMVLLSLGRIDCIIMMMCTTCRSQQTTRKASKTSCKLDFVSIISIFRVVGPALILRFLGDA